MIRDRQFTRKGRTQRCGQRRDHVVRIDVASQLRTQGGHPGIGDAAGHNMLVKLQRVVAVQG